MSLGSPRERVPLPKAARASVREVMHEMHTSHL